MFKIGKNKGAPSGKSENENAPKMSPEIREMKRELGDLKSAMTAEWPFLASLLRKCRIIADPETEDARVNEKNEMRVNPEFFRQLNVKSKAFVYGREALRIGLSHPSRMQGKDLQVANMASDCVVHSLLSQHGLEGVSLPGTMVISKNIAAAVGKKEEDVARMSFEEIYHLLEEIQNKNKSEKQSKQGQSSKEGKQSEGGGKSDEEKKEENEDKESGSGGASGKSEDKEESKKNDQPENGGNSDQDEDEKDSHQEGGDQEEEEQEFSAGSESKTPSKGEVVIQEGDPEAYDSKKDSEEIGDYWSKALAEALVQAKMAGKLPAGIEKILSQLLEAKVDWKSVIKRYIFDGIGKSIITTWKRTSRKHSMMPGIKRLTKPTVWCLVDTSGSTMFTGALVQFLSEVYSLIKSHGRGIVIPWDAIAYPRIELTRAVDVGYAMKEGAMKGGGGTGIAPALLVVFGEMKRQDVVVVLTDGQIFDLQYPETQDLLYKVARKSSSAIFGTMNINVSIPVQWRKVKIEVGP